MCEKYRLVITSYLIRRSICICLICFSISTLILVCKFSIRFPRLTHKETLLISQEPLDLPIISLIHLTLIFYSTTILSGEISCWSFLGVNGFGLKDLWMGVSAGILTTWWEFFYHIRQGQFSRLFKQVIFQKSIF